jgi:class 3 adenylate cyclase
VLETATRPSHAGLVQTATVLFTDMVASTQLRARLGDAAADVVVAQHDALIDDVLRATGGRLVKRMGDGVLAVFSSAKQALEAAALVQRRVAQLRARRPEHGFSLRVGIAAGDVSLGEHDVSGTPVVEAYRLCEQAGADHVLLSDVVRVLVGSRSPWQLVPAGELDVRGLPDPLVAYSLEWHHPMRPSLGDHGVDHPPLLLRAGRTAFVGRRQVVALLQEHLERALGGDSRSVLLAGEPGIGKTRTAAELAGRAADAGAVVLYGRCDEGLQAPYQPFVEALEAYARRAREPRLGRLARELTRLVPELPDLLPGIGAPLLSDPRTEEYRLHEAVAAWLADASSEEGLVLVLDDLHWADAATLSLLVHVLRTLSHVPSRVLVVGTYRDTEPDVEAGLGGLLAEVRRTPGSDRVTLEGLDEADVVELLTVDAGHELDEVQRALVSRVWAECDGNPFFVRELRRHLVETGAMRKVGDRWRLVGDIDIPDSVRDVVGRRLAVLSRSTVEVLRAASVLGRSFTLEVLAAVMDVSESTVVDALDDAARARLVEETASGRYRFAHMLVRTTLYDGMSATRRARAHRRVVEQLQGKGDVGALAHHALLSEATGDAELLAAEWALAAGEQALESRALADAEQRLRAALEHLERLPGTSRQVCRALCALGEAQRDQGDQGYRETLARAGDLAAGLEDRELLVRATLADDRGTTLVAAPDPGRVARIERALELTGPEPSEDRAMLLARLVGEVTFAGDPDRRRRLTIEAEQMTRRLDDPRAVARVMVRTSMAAHMLTGWETSLARARHSARLADEVGDPALRITAMSWLSSSQVVAGQLAAAEETSMRMLDLAEETSPAMRWFARMLQIKFVSLRGRFDVARAENDACLELAQALREPDAETIWGAISGVVAQNAGVSGDFADAAGSFAEANPTLPNWKAAHAMMLGEAGRLPEAREALARYDLDPAATMEEPFAYMAPWALASAASQLRDVDLARRVQRVLAPHRGRWSHVYLGVLGPVRWALGRCATAAGALDIAVEELTEALTETRFAGSDALSGLIALDLASAFAARAGSSDRSAALDLLDEVADGDVRHLEGRVLQLRETLAS